MIKDFIDTESVTNIPFYTSIKEIVVCNICTGILINPRECTSCQNSFCKKCLEEWTCLKNSCPYKCEKSEFRDSSRTLKNLLEKLQFKCNFCNNEESEILYLNFLSHLSSCEKIKVNCPTCDTLVNKKKLNENKFHLKLKDDYASLLEKYNLLNQENKKLKDDLNYLKELQTSSIKNYTNSSNVNPNAKNRRNSLTKMNINFPTFNNQSEISEDGIVDKCEHFKGNYFPIFSCCERSFPCYICHDKVKDHEYKISSKVVCLICKNIYSGPKCNVCNTYQVYRKK